MALLDLDMGKYASFVWPAFAISAATLLAVIVEALWRSALWRRRAERREPGEP